MSISSSDDSSIKSSIKQTGNELQAAVAAMSKGCAGQEALHEKVKAGPGNLAEAYAKICADERKRQDVLHSQAATPQVLFQVVNGGGQILQAVLPPLIATLPGHSAFSNSSDEYRERREKIDEFLTGSDELQTVFAKAEHIKTVLQYSNKDTPPIAKFLSLPVAHTAALLAPWVIGGMVYFAKRKIFG
jgi:hypothetical protein